MIDPLTAGLQVTFEDSQEAVTFVLAVPGVDYAERSWRDKRFGAVNLLNGIFGNLEQPATTGELKARGPNG